jgi:hypothetical protein
MKKILIIALLLQALNMYGQNGAAFILLLGHSKENFDHKMHEGMIILNNNDTVKGRFQYADLEFPSFNIKYYPDSVKKKRYFISKIKIAILDGSDTSLMGKNSTVFIKLYENNKIFHRQLTFGDIEIFDPLFLVNEKPGLVSEDLTVLFKGKKYKTHSDKELVSLLNKLRPDLIPTFENKSRQEIIKKLNRRF